MSGNVDRRVRRTRQAIQRALVELILEKGYEPVTVTDLIARADVGRSTFYAHYPDKQAVLFSALEEMAFLRAAPRHDGPPFSFSLPMFEHVREQRRLVRALLGRRGGRVVMAYGESLLEDVVREELLARGARPGATLDLAVTCVTGAFMALVRKWVDEELRATPAELDAVFRASVAPGVLAALEVPGRS